jgi:ATP-dependent DNA helicase PIF1
MNNKRRKLGDDLYPLAFPHGDICNTPVSWSNSQLFELNKLPPGECIEWSHDLALVFHWIMRYPVTVITGPAGTGKSFLLRQTVSILRQHTRVRLGVCAPTGIAAVNCGGVTMHSFIAMGLAREPIHVLLQKLGTWAGRKCKENLTSVDVLCIDECFAVNPDLFVKFDLLCKAARGNNRPFGGMKLLLIGDALQLPPVRTSTSGTIAVYIFQTDIWKSLDIPRVSLRKMHRQSDPQFVRILNEIRVNALTPSSILELKGRVGCELPLKITRLATYVKDADAYNHQQLSLLPAAPVTYTGKYHIAPACPSKKMSIADNDAAMYQLQSTDTRNKHFSLPDNIILKVGALVILRLNLNARLCNGSSGIVLELSEDYVTVDFGTEVIQLIEVCLSKDIGKTGLLCFTQIPLSLGYSITIHKSQGLTLDNALVDDKAFACAQYYVAVSRVRKLSNVFLTRFTPNCIKVNAAAIQFQSDPTFSTFCSTWKDGRSPLYKWLTSPLFEPHILTVIDAFL